MGDWFNTIALVVILNRYTDSGLAVGSFFLTRALPPFFLGPLAGVVADRFSRRAVLIISDVLRAVIVLGFLLVDRPDRLWLIYGLSVLQFSASTFFEPARAALLPSLVAQDDLLVANTLSSSTWSAMLTLGGVVGGLVAALFGAQTALVIDSLSFILSASLIFSIPALSVPHLATPIPENGWTNFLAGLAYVRGNPSIGVVTLVKGLGQVGTTDIIMALYAKQVFAGADHGATALGLMYAGFGFGAVAGPVLLNRWSDGSSRWLRRAIVTGFAFIPFGLLLIGVGPTLPIVLLGCVIRGMGGSVNWTYSDVLIQMNVPNQFLGRVFALDFGLFTLAMSVSLGVTGWLADVWQIAPRVLASVAAAGALVPIVIWILAVRAIEQVPVVNKQ